MDGEGIARCRKGRSRVPEKTKPGNIGFYYAVQVYREEQQGLVSGESHVVGPSNVDRVQRYFFMDDRSWYEQQANAYADQTSPTHGVASSTSHSNPLSEFQEAQRVLGSYPFASATPASSHGKFLLFVHVYINSLALVSQ
jgi:hypothetical protein